MCGIIELEVLYSVRCAKEHRRIRLKLRGLERLTTPDEVWDRALDVHGALAKRGQHRAVAIPELVIAAVAERHNIAVIATCQPVKKLPLIHVPDPSGAP